MVCDGPDPPDDSPQNLIPPPRHDLMGNGNHDESDDENNDHFGYEPLAQGPEMIHSDRDSEDEQETNETNPTPPSNVPPIEPMENALAREVWSSPRSNDPIEMNNERAEQVMSLMANFALPQNSIPEWAQSISEDQWKQTLNDRIERLRSNR